MTVYTPEKYTWTHADFDQMGWHNATLHAIAFMPGHCSSSLDIDYIFEWIHPRTQKKETCFRFQVAPCTLVFHDVDGFGMEKDPGWDAPFTIDFLKRSEVVDASAPGGSSTRWRIEGHYGHLYLTASGFTQYVRRPVILSKTQALSAAQRGGIAFTQTTPESVSPYG